MQQSLFSQVPFRPDIVGLYEFVFASLRSRAALQYLDQRIAEEDEHKLRFLHRRDLNDGSAELWHAAVEQDEEIKKFVLYLGVFDKSEITRVCDRVLGSAGSLDDDGEFERTELEGRTCQVFVSIVPISN